MSAPYIIPTGGLVEILRRGTAHHYAGGCQGCGDNLMDEAADRIEALTAALTKLSNEVMASLPLMEPLARREFGNTNYNILIQRAEEARVVLKGEMP